MDGTEGDDDCGMAMTTVRDLLRILPHEAFTGPASAARRAVRGCSTDSRSLKKGEVFIALTGERFDGHDFIEAAAAKGAAVAVVSGEWFRRGSHLQNLPPMIVVEDTLAAYGRIATAHRSAFQYPVIAVAGSNGKTTTKELIADVLATRYDVLRTEGNLNNLIGVPAMMLRMAAHHTAAVIEIGTNAPGEIARLCGILRPTHGIITNIGREHLELLGSVEGVAREEGALFDYLAANGGTAFVNLDDPHIARMGRRLERRITYGRAPRADVAGKKGRLNEAGAPSLEITDRRGGRERSFVLQLRTPGEHTAQNALAAAAVGLGMRIPPVRVKKVLEQFEPHIYKGGYARLAVMKAANGATVLNDTYNSNPDSTLAALRALRALRPGRGGRRIALLADMKELGASSATEHAGVGRELAGMPKIDLAIFHGAEMRHAYEAMMALAPQRALYFDDRRRLLDELCDMVTPADAILVKGSRGMKMEEIVLRLLCSETDPAW